MKISPFLQQNYLILLKYMEGASIKPSPRVNFTGECSSPLLHLSDLAEWQVAHEL